jgi:hypothetical protein
VTTTRNVAVVATANATGGAAGTRGVGFVPVGAPANANSVARSSLGTVSSGAASPASLWGPGSAASAMTTASIGAGAAALVNTTAGQTVSNAVLLPNGGGATVGLGAMSIGYGGQQGDMLAYSTQATFNYAQSLNGHFRIDFGSYNFSGLGFSSSELDVYINGVDHTYSFTTLAQAHAFFNKQTIDYGIVTGLNNVMIDYSLTSNSGGDGFGFTYGLEYTPASPAPEAGKGVLTLAALVLAGALAHPRRN